ncbi:KAR-UP oxidoreductase 1 [Hibiscus trionum]|uniref:KAR-UP oxidoreductase 1 n=1 Tax=Hibiscus trionum TaxID=183268 RepID=A0A9W7ISA8_HIBTR|nr:KAR-UP oxidoreductase 1 [Hibiscus trionum]
MANAAGMLTQTKAVPHSLANSINLAVSPTDHCDDQVPTVDYSLLFSNDQTERAKSLEHLGKACQEFGFFYLINGVEESVVEAALMGVTDFFQLANQEEKSEYLKKNSKDKIRWVLRSHAGENRENLKIVAHPEYHFPTKPANFRDAFGEYLKEMHEVELGLAKAISRILGHEETYIEKEFNLEAGFDVSSMNLYPPSFQSKGSIGVANHTDPGFFVSLIQDVNGGL